MFSRHFTREPLPTILYAAFLLALIITVPCFAQTYSVVATFESNPHSMDSPGTQQIVQGRNGQIYAGTVANGALFSASPLGSLAQVADNGGPQGVTLGADGNFYTTVYFDRIGCGEVWKVTRMFAPAGGVAEDPATGSAAGPLCLHLARHGVVQFGEEIEITQGVEIQRPSKLFARVDRRAERIERVEVGGSAVVVARGEFRL